MIFRRPRLFALLGILAMLLGFGGFFFWQSNAQWQLGNRAFSDLKAGRATAIPELLQLGAHGDKAAAAALVEVYVQGDRELGVAADDNKAAYWAGYTWDPLGLDIWYAKAFLDGTEPGIARDTARAAFWSNKAYEQARGRAR